MFQTGTVFKKQKRNNLFYHYLEMQIAANWTKLSINKLNRQTKKVLLTKFVKIINKSNCLSKV